MTEKWFWDWSTRTLRSSTGDVIIYCAGAEPPAVEPPPFLRSNEDADLIAAAPEMFRLLRDVFREGWVSSGMTLDVNIGDLLFALTRGAEGYPPKV